MTAGESEEYGWHNYRMYGDLLDFGIDMSVFDASSSNYLLIDFIIFRSAIASSYPLLASDSICEDESSSLASQIKSRDRAFSSTWWLNAMCLDKADCDIQWQCHSATSNSTAGDLNKEYWTNLTSEKAFVATPSCGLCVLGNLSASSGDHLPCQYPGGNNPEGCQKNSRNSYGEWGSCRSTRTLISRSSESLKGTGRWLLEHERYTQWRNQPSAFLWLCGRPGAGKSVLISTVIQDLEKTRRSGEIVAYYFANGYYRGVNTAKAILCSILGQFLFRELTRNSFAEVLTLLNDLNASVGPLSTTRMIWLLSNIRHMLRSHETLYLLLDGLDEVTHSPQEQELLLELIDHASRHDPNHQIKCFISSRSTFFEERLPKGALRVDLDSHPLTRNDMSLYVQDSLHKFFFAYPSRDIKEMADNMLDSASGSFLVLRLILEASQATPANSCATNENLSADLTNFGEIELATLYRGMLARIKNCNKEAVLSMLRWVTFAARPLESHELLALYKQTGIEIKEEDISTISAGLLVSTGNQIQFTHFSVREYLESQLRDRWEELSEEANEMIAHVCLKVLSPENLLQSLSMSTKTSSFTKSAIASGFVPYAQTHWMFHYKRGERRSAYLAGLLHDILEQCLKYSNKNGHGMEEETKQTAGESIRSCIGGSLPGEYRQFGMEEWPNIVNIALRVGARFGFAKLAKLELDMGANLNIASGPEQQTPLCLAAKAGHLEVVELLLKRGADLNITSRSGLSPLAYAMVNGHFEVQDLLMQYASGLQRSSSYEEVEGGYTATQELWLTAMISSSCISCSTSRVDYEVSKSRKT
jgi:hypothetical protein